MHSLKINAKGKVYTYETQSGRTIMEVMRENGFMIPALCGGRGACGKCRVRLIKGITEITTEEHNFFSEYELSCGYRLACMARVFTDLEIITEPTDEGFKILSFYKVIQNIAPDNFQLVDFKIEKTSASLSSQILTDLGIEDIDLNVLWKLSGAINRGGPIAFGADKLKVLTQNNRLYDVFHDNSPKVLGIAIDIGTTTICLQLLDLISGIILSADSRINSQRVYGADVISRIKASSEGRLHDLRACVTNDILEGIKKLISHADSDFKDVYQVNIAANTTMTHILLDIPCESLGVAPFTPTVTDGLRLRFADIFRSPLLNCHVYILPSVSAYVGSDIVSGLFFCGAHRKKCLFVDIGTNCEMAVTDGENIICSAAAAGPAFEGGNISCGAGSVPGAISSCRYDNSRFVWETIGCTTTNDPPCGICGTGLIDAAFCMLENGMMDDTGRLANEYADFGVEIAPGIRLTQKDIRELQLAKSAMRAGIEIILSSAGIKDYAEIDTVYLSGSFGYNINTQNAAAIGMIPEALLEKVVSVGNSSLGGCTQALLDKYALTTIADIADKAREINLSDDTRFNELFAEHMLFS